MKANILLIDSYPALRESLSHALRAEGYDVTAASNGQEALVSLRETAFDLVVLDFDLPASSGWETLGEIITTSLSLPLIILASPSDRRLWVAQKGVVTVLEKPLEMRPFLDALARALAETPPTHGRETGAASPQAST